MHKQLLSIAILAATTAPVLAQRTPAGAGAGATPAGTGGAGAVAKTQTLREIMEGRESNDRLLYYLGGMELDVLLDRAYTNFNIPADVRPTYKVLSALPQLAHADRLSDTKRRELVASVVGGIDRVLEKQTDPSQVMRLGSTLLINGTMRDVNTLEYWGKEGNAKVMAQLRPVAEAVSRVYNKAAELATAKAGALAGQIKDPNDPRLADVDRIEELAGLAKYNRAMNDYAIALATDSADKTAIAKAADGAIETLKEFLAPEIGVQNMAQTRIAKLCLTKADYDEARRNFDEVIARADPKKEWGVIYEAKYFRISADIGDKKLADAEKGVQELAQWQATNIPSDVAGVKEGIDAALRMLEYRVQKAQYEKTKDAKYNDQAIAILLKLLQDRPDLRSIIFGQLMNQLPADADVKKLDPLLLRALVAQGEVEARKDPKTLSPEDQTKWRKTIMQALSATKELFARKDLNTDKKDLDAAAYLLGLFLDLADQDQQAANAYLDYVQKFAGNPKLVEHAMQNAEALIADLRKEKSTRNAPLTRAAYLRFLEIAVKPPFNRKEFAFELAVQMVSKLQEEIKNLKPPISELKQKDLVKRLDECMALFEQVPAKDKRRFYASYYHMMALIEKLDVMPKDSPDRAATIDKIQEMADRIDKQADEEIKNADDNQRPNMRLMHVRTALTAAALAVTEKPTAKNTPEQAVKLLDTFEEDVKGMDKEDEMMGEAYYVRFQALMSLKREKEAMENLESYLDKLEADKRPGADAKRSIQVVYGLLKSFEDEFDKAMREKNEARATQLASYQAMLVDRLITRVEKSNDANIKKYLPEYKMFAVKVKRRASGLEKDPARKKEILGSVLALYEKQRSEVLATKKPDDPAVLGLDLMIGLIHYDMGNYVEAQKRLSPLFAAGKVGIPKLQVPDKLDKDRMVEVWNSQYWEVFVKLARSNIEISKMQGVVANPQTLIDQTKSKLIEILTLYGMEAGGPDWSDDVDKLRIDLLGPNYKPRTIDDIAAATQPSK